MTIKRIAAILVIFFSLSLPGCVASAAAGLNPYVDSADGYQFLYPNGWQEIKVSNGPDVVFHDLIEDTENLSVVISPVPDGKKLADLGDASEVGYKLSKNAIAPEGSGRTAELVSAESQTAGDKTYYVLEYAVKLPNNKLRHNLASVAVSRGKLYTFNISATEKRWQKLKSKFTQVVNSFSVY
ncbi:MAG TPA: photosystem II reaction center PsbP [Halomicronema sp.]